MYTANGSQITEVGAAADRYYLTEASDIGLPVGEWPQLISTDIGNKQPLVFFGWRVSLSGEEAVYRQPNSGIEVRVLNT